MKLKIKNGYLINPINIITKMKIDQGLPVYRVYATDSTGVSHLVTDKAFEKENEALEYIETLEI